MSTNAASALGLFVLAACGATPPPASPVVATPVAQVGTIFSTFKAPGVQQESFAGKAAHELDAARIARLHEFMQHALDSTHVPATVLPTFRLADADVTKRVLMRPTVCACTGMPRRDLDLFFGVTTATPEARLISSTTPTSCSGKRNRSAVKPRSLPP